MTDDGVTAFPEAFIWGAATSAYQIEGSPLSDGAGASIWHRFSHGGGRIAGDANGDRACDHYHRYREDVALMADLGLQAYRFSVSWSRVLPTGRGTVNPAGLGFYGHLVDALLEVGVTPFVTLYHWDLPAALEDAGGWRHADSPRWFADYAEILFRNLGDRVRHWITINEPWVISHEGYVTGHHAPGYRDVAAAGRVSHHLVCAHGMAVNRFREGAYGGVIGIALNLEPKYPASPAADDEAATGAADAYMNRQYLEPLMTGRYPVELATVYGAPWWDAVSRDPDLLSTPGDFIGVNYYTRAVVQADRSARPVPARSLMPAEAVITDMGWEVYPKGLYDVLRRVHRTCGDLPVYITENGAAIPGEAAVETAVPDRSRSEYLRTHLIAARRALDDGVPLHGYFAWSLLDNFEWRYGYDRRFGIVHVDFETQRRTPKDSARFYANIIRTRGANLSVDARG